MTRTVSQHFVTLNGRWGERQVHYRRAGSGPLLLALHQSPQSSRELEPLMEQWSEYFTIVAPDSPGYGLSDPLGIDEAELSDFADATVEFMDAIGAERFGIYGFHTGGMIGVAIAHGHAERVTGFACNGIAVPTDTELKEILAVYLPRFEPRWDGGHLAWLWAKTREQTIFFPWHNRTLAGRMDFPMPSPEHQQNSVCEFLRAGDHYHVGYRAAFVFHAERIVPELTVPGLFTAAVWDPLQPHLDRLENTPDCVEVAKSETPAEATQRCLDQVRAHPGGEPPGIPPTQPLVGHLWRQFIQTGDGPVAIRRGGSGAGVPVIVLHGVGGSGATIADLLTGLSKHRNVIAIDLPGHGESAAAVSEITTQTCADSVLSVLNGLDLQQVDLVGVDGGSFVAADLASRHPVRVRRLAAVHPLIVAASEVATWRERGLPSFSPLWAGGHLLSCWHMVRDGRLYFPWFQRDQAGIRWQEPELDDRRIQLEVTEFLKSDGAWQTLLDEQLEYPLSEALQVCGDKAIVCGSSSSPWFGIAQDLAGQCELPFLDLQEDEKQWGARLAAALAG